MLKEEITKIVVEEKFIIEYPKNYNEIVERKLQILEREYQETIKCNIKQEILDAENKENNDDDSESEEMENKENIDNNYYQHINENENEFLEVEEDDLIQNNNKNEENKNEEEVNFEFISTITNNENKSISNTDYIFLPKNPIKNPEKIKQAMKSIKMPTPKWAQNLSDEDFVNMIKSSLKK